MIDMQPDVIRWVGRSGEGLWMDNEICSVHI